MSSSSPNLTQTEIKKTTADNSLEKKNTMKEETPVDSMVPALATCSVTEPKEEKGHEKKRPRSTDTNTVNENESVIAQKEIPHSNTDNSTKDLELSQCYADLREQTQKNMDLQNKYNEDIVALSAKSKESVEAIQSKLLELQNESQKDKQFIAQLQEQLLAEKINTDQLSKNIEKEGKEKEALKTENIAIQEKLRISQSTVEAMEVRYAQLSVAHKTSQEELEKKRVDYKNMETNFYSYLRTVRATDDDLSTIQAEISQISSQLNNFCMTLRSKMDLVAGTAFVFNTWPEKEGDIRKYLLKEGSETETLDTGYITLFVEKYIIETLIQNIFDQPLQLGVSVNSAYKQVEQWISQRKDEWSIRLRQQMCMLVSKHAGEEEEQIEEAKKVLADTIISQLASVYPSMVVELNHKKIAVFVSRVTKLNLAMKGQEVPVSPIIINEGIDTFNGQFMNPVNKGKPEGIVLISIFPPFSTSDLKDSSQALVSGKVLCV